MMESVVISRAERVLKHRRFIRMRDFCEQMGGIIWQHAVPLLQELGWYKYNAYQWAHPDTKKTL